MSRFDDLATQYGQQYNLDPSLIGAVISQESGGIPTAWNRTGGGQGAAGLMQVRAPALADYNAANGTKYTMQDLTDPKIGVGVGSWYLAQQFDRFNDPAKALSAYKEGAGTQAAQQGTSPYAQQVLNRIGSARAATTLPGVPSVPSAASSTTGNSDAFSALPVAGATGKTAAPVAGASDPFSSLPVAQAAAPRAPAGSTGAQSPVAASPGPVESAVIGFGKGVGDVASGIEQMAGHGVSALGNVTGWTPLQRAGNYLVNDANYVVNQTNTESAAARAAHPIATGAGEIAGNALMTAPVAIAAPAVETLGGMAATGAGLGAVAGGLTPVSPDSQNFTLDKLKQMGAGALGGAVLTPALGAVGRAISPNVSSDVQTLLDRGVTPTPGQILGGGFSRTEDKLSSIPYLGDLIKNAQGRAVSQFNVAAYNEALAPIGETFDASASSVGQEGLEQVRRKIGDVYNTVLPQMQLKVDPQFTADVTNLGQMANGLPQAQQDTFMKVLKTQIFGKLGPQANMDGQTLKGVQEELGDRAAGYLKDPSYDNRQLGAAINALRDAVDSNLMRVNPPELSQQLSNANTAWANFARLRAAGASTGAANNSGVFSAAQLQSAVRSSDRSAGKGAFATGNALMQDLSGAGQRVLGTRYPDSGTVGRGLMTLLAPGSVGAGLIAAPGSTLATLGGIGVGSLPYTQAGQRLAATLLTARPGFAAPIGQAVTGLGRLAVPATFPTLLPGGQ